MMSDLKPFRYWDLAAIVAASLTLLVSFVQGKETPADDSETKAESWVDPMAAVDMSEFLDDTPQLRTDIPERGHIVINGDDLQPFEMAHWDEYRATLNAKRWGRYQLFMRYDLARAGLGTQIRIGDQRVKGVVKGSAKAEDGRRALMGEIYIPKSGEFEVKVMTPTTDQHAAFVVRELRLVPTFEGENPAPAEDGTITLLAKGATTWSETMRYEPDEKKNCLGYWSDAKDFAEWEFEVTEPKNFAVEVFFGCGKGSGGSVVSVVGGETTLKFDVPETGGFQNWQSQKIGEIQFKKGTQRLLVRPESKAAKAVMDIQKVVLTPIL